MLLIRWQVQRGVVAIPKSTTPARIAANFAVFDFALDEADLKQLDAFDAGKRLIKVRREGRAARRGAARRAAARAETP